ncbi:MAG TPA: trypsin-like peptidase domain-containing protein [Thermoleophilia bacterium]|nr:trypsin-like peptidase domain-containing protein [Thermoleophilia bacterium]
MRLGKFLTTMVAGFVGAALLLGVAYATGVVGTSSTTVKTVQGEPVAFKTTGYTPQEIYEKYVGSVVEIQSTFPGSYDMWGQYSGDQRALGTGFVVSEDGDILTNAHVVSESGLVAGSVTVIFKGDGADDTQVPGTIVGVDESTDVALIRVDPSTAPELLPIPFGDSTQVAVGEEVVAIGNPLGLDFSLSSGVVSATDRELQSPNGAVITGGIQTDAAINSGNSGGPLIDASGHVIGINEQIASQGGGNEGIGFAVPINTAVSVLEQMKSGAFQPQTQQAPAQDGSEYWPY